MDEIGALKKDLALLAAENLAMRFVQICLLNRLGGAAPALRGPILGAFDDAANQAENFCMALGREAGDLPEVLRVIEEMRMVLAGKGNQPRAP